MKPRHFIKGTSASPGVVLGAALVRRATIETRTSAQTSVSQTAEDFTRAVRRSALELTSLLALVREKVPEVVTDIVQAHCAILEDPLLTRDVLNLIDENVPASQAILTVVSKYASVLAGGSNERIREKSQDLLDLGARLLKNLGADDSEGADCEGRIVILPELLPSDVLDLVAQKACGVILTQGGVTAHVSLLARALELPMVIAEKQSVDAVAPDAMILLDANLGSVIVNPSAEVVDSYRNLLDAHGRIPEPTVAGSGECATIDHRSIRLYASINLISEVPCARNVGACGIGLYRSEMPFLLHAHSPSEEEQCEIYKRIIANMPGSEFVFRTLDLGGDKILDYFPHEQEFNPSLGLRGIRFSLSHPQLFKQQVRAILRAGHEVRLRILFPLIPSLDAFLRAKNLVRECINELSTASVLFTATPEFGAMIEVPSAVMLAPELIEAADFVSIGTNDLVQHLLAVDRLNPQVSTWYVPYHPAVLRSIKVVAEAGEQSGKDVFVCGDMAADPIVLPALIGMGLSKFSISPRRLPAVSDSVRAVNYADAQELAVRLVRAGKVADVRDILGIPQPRARA